jgi:DNA-binding NarL/FixJ family response regulator
LKITERTVKAHISSLYRKLGPENRVELALLARQLGVRVAPER